MIDIVILSYAHNERLKTDTDRCLTSLFESEPNAQDLFMVYVVESEPDVNWNTYPNTLTLIPNGPYGYHKYMNYGRRAGSREFVCLCNADLQFHPGWATEILKAARANPEILSFSPICPLTQPQYGIKPDTGLYVGYDVRKHLSGWCIFQRRQIYYMIEDLDETFTHWYCDNDYALTLWKENILHMLVTSSLVTHHANNLGATAIETCTEEELKELTQGNSLLFQEKWKRYFR